MFRRLAFAILASSSALLVAFSGTAGAAQAPVTSLITLDQPSPRLGDSVTFTTMALRSIKNPRIQIACFQNGVLVWGTAGARTESFKLGGDSSAWKTAGGAANCTATLYYWLDGRHVPQTFVSLATTTFVAAG